MATRSGPRTNGLPGVSGTATPSPGGLIATITDVASQDGHADLAQRLAEAGVLPMFGFPTRERLLYQSKPRGRVITNSIGRQIDIAISEFAPGSEVVKDKGVYTAIGLADYERRGPSNWVPVAHPEGPVSAVGLCRACGAVYPGGSKSACPTCSAAPETGLYRVATICQPRGFRTNFGSPADYDGTYEFTPWAGHARLSLTDIPTARQVGDLEFRHGKARVLIVNDAGGADFRLTPVRGARSHRGQVVGVGVHVVTGVDLRRAAVPAPVVGNDPVTVPQEEQSWASQSSDDNGQPWLNTIGWPLPQSL